jgi:hypothetical protein
VIDSVHPTAHHPRHSRKARTAVAAGLLGLAFLSMVAFIGHMAKNQAPDSPLFANNALESSLGLVWITSGLLAMILARRLHSPARQLVLIFGGISTVFAILLWFGIVVSQ